MKLVRRQLRGMARLVHARRSLPLAVALSLSTVVLMSSPSSIPTVQLSQMDCIGDGATVRVQGVLTASQPYESGWCALTVTDLGGHSSARVLVAPAPQAPVGSPSIGDLLSVTGETSTGDTGPVLFCQWDAISVLASSRCVLTVALVCENWEHFLDDRFEVAGELWDGRVLRDLSGVYALAIEFDDCPQVPPPGRCVVDATLLMSYSGMTLTLKAWAVYPLPE